jgi:hypothetical protein
MFQWAKAHAETVFGTVVTPETAVRYFTLIGDNPVNLMVDRPSQEYRSADSLNRRVIRVATRYTVAGAINTLAFCDGTAPSTFMDDMLNWATNITGNDLPSKTLTINNSIRVRQYAGVKVRQLTLTGAAGTEEGTMRLNLDLVGQRASGVPQTPSYADPVFAQPSMTVFPRTPYVFQESKGGLIVATSGSTARTLYNSFSMTITNEIPQEFDENAFVGELPWFGRTIDLTVGVRFKSKTDRDNFEQDADYNISVLFTKANPAHTMLLDFKGLNYVRGIDQNLPLAASGYETLTFSNFVSSADGTDFSYSIT